MDQPDGSSKSPTKPSVAKYESFIDMDLLVHIVVVIVAGVALHWFHFHEGPTNLLMSQPITPPLLGTIVGGLAATFLHQSPERP